MLLPKLFIDSLDMCKIEELVPYCKQVFPIQTTLLGQLFFKQRNSCDNLLFRSSGQSAPMLISVYSRSHYCAYLQVCKEQTFKVIFFHDLYCIAIQVVFRIVFVYAANYAHITLSSGTILLSVYNIDTLSDSTFKVARTHLIYNALSYICTKQ